MESLIKFDWSDLRSVVQRIDPTFAGLVDEISPNIDCPLYLSSYKYGETIGDNAGTLLKNKAGQRYRLGDPDTPKDIMQNLGYGITNSPFMMILDKTFEWQISHSNNKACFPIYIEGLGT